MVATVRRYEDIQKVRSEGETSTVGTRPLPAVRKLSGFSGCYVFDDEHDPETMRTVQGGFHDSAAAW